MLGLCDLKTLLFFFVPFAPSRLKFQLSAFYRADGKALLDAILKDEIDQ